MVFSQESTLVGDVDCSGEVNSEDASLILQFVTNVIDELPCQDNMTGLTPEQLQEIINMMDEQLSINYSGGGVGSGMPIMISSISSETMHWGDALIYCDGLEEDGYSDWFLPNQEQLTYAISGGCELPDGRTAESLWSTTPSGVDYGRLVTFYESGSDGISTEPGYQNIKCRCVRFGEGETSEGSSGSSSSSGSNTSISSSSDQAITMIGPMFVNEDFPNFYRHPYTNAAYQSLNYLTYTDAIRFCGQLEYNGFDDWFLPSYIQIQDYYEKNGSIVFPTPISFHIETFWLKTYDTYIPSYNGGLQAITARITGDDYITYEASYNNKIMDFNTTNNYSYNSHVLNCFCVR